LDFDRDLRDHFRVVSVALLSGLGLGARHALIALESFKKMETGGE